MRKKVTVGAVVAGALMGAAVGAASLAAGCMTPEERRALSVADCVAQMALGLPQRPLPAELGTISEDDLVLAVLVVDGVRACRREDLVTEPPFADGGAP